MGWRLGLASPNPSPTPNQPAEPADAEAAAKEEAERALDADIAAGLEESLAEVRSA